MRAVVAGSPLEVLKLTFHSHLPPSLPNQPDLNDIVRIVEFYTFDEFFNRFSRLVGVRRPDHFIVISVVDGSFQQD